uniref:Exosome complex component 10 homolog n=1 Tax=Cacopsylla melanoneura TaxID=428564 RepID=A0A8D8QYF5_9HEMI
MLIILFVCIILTNMTNTNQEGEVRMDAAESEKPQSEMRKAANPEAVKAFDDALQNAYKTIVKCTKTAQSFPSSHENSLLIASPAYINGVASTSEKVMGLVDKLLRRQNISKSMSNLYHEGQKDVLIDANDKLLESINTRIDVMAGVKTPSALLPSTPRVVKESWNKKLKSSNVWQEVTQARNKPKNWFTMTKANVVVERPQLRFKDKIDNSHETLFEPKLKDKPNALKPLAILLEKYDVIESFSHPYEYELDLYAPNENFLSCDTPREPLSLEETPLVMVVEPVHVKQLVADLRQQKEIGIDLEYHHYRSFQGYTCLMQISTREKDYVVDTLKLREHLEVLNEIFTDNKIVKVFHGADLDIRWLQKDFGVYVVGMFDTHQACKFLSMPRQSLAYLLKHYCNVDSDKTFQLFDWRHRPLPKPALLYARSDTHYLLYVYDRMKQDLVEAARGKQNLVMSTFNNSRNVCKYKYEKPVFKPEGYKSIFRSHTLLNNQQKYALSELYTWRDKTARERDESTGYVLPNHMLLQIAQSIPRDIQGIFACCNPVPQLVKELVLEIHAIILKARLQPLTKPVEKTNQTVVASKKQQVDPPHDSMDSLNYKGLPPVFPDNANIIQLQPGMKLTVVHYSNDTVADIGKAVIGLFFEDREKVGSNKLTKIKMKTARFETPYQRFLKSKEYAKAVQEKLDKENAEMKKKQVKKEPEEKIPKVNVKQEKPEPVVLKQIKTEEKVEMEKEKRKKILQEREEGKEDQQQQQQPRAKKIKTEKGEDKSVGGKSEENLVRSEKEGHGKGKNIRNEPKDAANDKDNNTGKTKTTAVPSVDYSKVNFNKYMAKPNMNSGLNQNGKRPKGGKGGGGKPNKKKKR